MIDMNSTTSRPPKTEADVIIVGAGPVGLLTALRLGQAGVNTLVVERHESLLKAARAVVYMPVVIPALRQLGILDAIQKYAYLNRQGVVWRDTDGKPLAQLPLSGSDPNEFGGVLLLGQGKLGELILEELSKYPNVEIRFGLDTIDIKDDVSSQTVQLTVKDYKNPGSLDIHLQSRYVLGTDGANSKVRNLLGIEFDGSTYDQFIMIGTDIIYDFAKHENFTPLNFTVDPELWSVIVFTAQDEDGRPLDINVPNSKPQWRIAYGEDPSLPQDKESIWQRALERIKVYCPTAPESCELLRAEPYTMHQRHATQARKGRVMLAGDALHVSLMWPSRQHGTIRISTKLISTFQSNNPIGGLGLTGGILDAFCYGNAFTRVLKSKSYPISPTHSNSSDAHQDDIDDSLLTECANARLSTWKNTTNKLSQMNLSRLHAMDAENVTARKIFFSKLNDADVESREKFAGMVRKGLDSMMERDFGEGVENIIIQAQNQTVS